MPSLRINSLYDLFDSSITVHSKVLDFGLDYLRLNADELHILSADPGLTFANISTMSLGVKSAPTISAIADHPNGRKIIFEEFTDGVVEPTALSSCSYFALVDSVNSDILFVGKFITPSAVSGEDSLEFRINEFYIATSY